MGLMNEYISRKLNVIELESELLKLIKQYNQYTNSFLFVYSSAINKPMPDNILNMDDYFITFDLLNKIKSKKLDFYIETPGGSGETAEEIVRFLRSKFEGVNFVVSGEAKSAGTLLVLSGDEINMTRSGSLGPIDAQIRIGRSVISAYDYMEWIDEKKEEAEKNKKLNPFDATMVAQISPGELSGVNHSLRFAEDLITEWLPKYKFKNWTHTETQKKKVTQNHKEKRAREIVGELINHGKWRSHGRSIKISDLEDIKLKINCIDNDPSLCDIVYRIQTVIRLLFTSTSIYKIYATQDDKIFKQASQTTKPLKIPVKKADIVEVETDCPKCGKKYKIYAKFVDNPNIDRDFEKRKINPFPKNNKINCECGFEIDLTGIRNELETQTRKKIIS
jgi:hypothetical protein